MPILGLVITLERGPVAERNRTVDALRAHSGLDLGEIQGVKLPVVLERASESEVEPAIDALQSLPGVAYVDVVFAEFADVLPAPEVQMESKSWN
jgi:hypothetical protein